MKTITLITTSAVALAASAANAALFANYVDGTDVDTAAYTNLASSVVGVTVTNLAPFGLEGGVNVTRDSFAAVTPAGPTAGSAAGSEWLFGREGLAIGAASSTDNYVAFTITADPGNTLSLTNLVYDYYATSNEVALLFEGQAEAFISVDSGAFNSFGSVSSSDVDGVLLNNGAVVTANLDLSSITGASSVEVRVAFGNAGTNSGVNLFGGTGFVQGIQLNGDVVPEPSTALLGVLGALGLLRRRR